jgi:hypothetical protein
METTMHDACNITPCIMPGQQPAISSYCKDHQKAFHLRPQQTHVADRFARHEQSMPQPCMQLQLPEQHLNAVWPTFQKPER